MSHDHTPAPLDVPQTAPRRRALQLLSGAAAALATPSLLRAQGTRRAHKVSVGRIPWAAGNSPMTQYMINNKLFEKRAAELGYDLTVEWREYPTAIPMVEAIVGNNLDMGMWGNTPIIRAISAKLPISLMVVGEGRLRFVIATRKGSPIRTLQDLKGKSIAFVDFNSTSGYLYPRKMMRGDGIDPDTHFSKSMLAGGATEATMALVNGQVDSAMINASGRRRGME
jgi:ABC-type phosphate/phosphonate transport system substrate-binding protein